MNTVFTIYPHLSPEDREWFSNHPETEPPPEAVTALKAVLDAGHPSTAEDLAKLACAFQWKADTILFEQLMADLRNEVLNLRDSLRRAKRIIAMHGITIVEP